MSQRYECLNCGHEGPAREFAIAQRVVLVQGHGYLPHDERHCPCCDSAFVEGREGLIATPGCPQGAPA